MEHYKQLWIETFTGDLKRKHDLPLFASVLLKDNNESHIKTCNLCHCQHTIVENGRICQFVPVILIISQSPTPQSTTLLFHSGWPNWEDKCKKEIEILIEMTVNSRQIQRAAFLYFNFQYLFRGSYEHIHKFNAPSLKKIFKH